jgi:hypothetical protein
LFVTLIDILYCQLQFIIINVEKVKAFILVVGIGAPALARWNVNPWSYGADKFRLAKGNAIVDMSAVIRDLGTAGNVASTNFGAVKWTYSESGLAFDVGRHWKQSLRDTIIVFENIRQVLIMQQLEAVDLNDVVLERPFSRFQWQHTVYLC